MKTTVDLVLRREAAHFHLRFACEDCVHFEPGATPVSPPRCGNGWAASLRRADLDAPGVDRAARGADAPSAADATVSFCKEFELA